LRKSKLSSENLILNAKKKDKRAEQDIFSAKKFGSSSALSS